MMKLWSATDYEAAHYLQRENGAVVWHERVENKQKLSPECTVCGWRRALTPQQCEQAQKWKSKASSGQLGQSTWDCQKSGLKHKEKVMGMSLVIEVTPRKYEAPPKKKSSGAPRARGGGAGAGGAGGGG